MWTHSSCLSQNMNRGFTLIEMMVVLAVAGLLYFVALPGYRHAMIKSYRAAGKGVLMEVMSRQEQYFINNKRYADSLPGLGLPSDYYVDTQSQPASAARAIYKIELVFDAAVYKGVKAIPQNLQRRDGQCMTFAISRLGVRSAISPSKL